MIAQVDEHHPAMIAATVKPARQFYGFTDMGLAKFPTGVGAIGVHRKLSPEIRSNRNKARKARNLSQLSRRCDTQARDD